MGDCFASLAMTGSGRMNLNKNLTGLQDLLGLRARTNLNKVWNLVKVLWQGIASLAMTGRVAALVFAATLSVSCYAAPPASVKAGEAVSFDVYFKWGLIMPRAGDAIISFTNDKTVPNAPYRYRLLFKTAKFFDNFFCMRDTLVGYYSEDNKLLYSAKRTNDGDYYSVDELTFKYGEKDTEIHSRRYTKTRVKIDTVMRTEDFVTDLLGAIYFLRSIDRRTLQSGDAFDAVAAIGKDLVKMRYCYQNQAIVERGNVKYKTMYFKIDIHDDAFESTSTAAEVWVGDDDNFIPIKIRTKMKVGYAEIHFREATGLAHPLSSRIEMKN